MSAIWPRNLEQLADRCLGEKFSQPSSGVVYSSYFLHEFKLGNIPTHNARNINSTFGGGTVNKPTVQKLFEKFRSRAKNILVGDVEADPSRILSPISPISECL
ncbi:hypothetical protein NPIL_202041 [Nephila pilipes]|uniref:Mos1 transposase HTH domain-containing protein n=1 Tax=Nephila pilipes TaxID=299642 RepID=A0A8X6TYN4_NEPPI|nr:hypothetical protein NPIL_202041 [Nephila pilipes]